jgi:hypothetical protein
MQWFSIGYAFILPINNIWLYLDYESTGPYAEPLVHVLGSKPVEIIQVNPIEDRR